MSSELDHDTDIPIATVLANTDSLSPLSSISPTPDSRSGAAPIADNDNIPSSSRTSQASAFDTAAPPATPNASEVEAMPPLVPVGSHPLPPSGLAAHTRARRLRPDADSDAESSGSLPSLQTVSDSSDDVWTDEEDSEDDDDDAGDDDDYEYDEDEDEFDYGDPFIGSQTRAIISPFASGTLENILRTGPEPLPYPDGPDSPLVIGPRGTRNTIMRIFRDALANVGASSIPENDPKRASMIVKELETVPEDLVRRYEELRAGLDDEPLEGCAICRDAFIESVIEESLIIEDPSIAIYHAALPYPDGLEDKVSTLPRGILAFPCPGMHLFHSQCLSPWLGRKTTCPTCRYDIDPESLTLSFLLNVRERAGDPLANIKWRPPKGRGFKRWLEKQERKLEPGYTPDEESDEEDQPAPGATPSVSTPTPIRPHNASTAATSVPSSRPHPLRRPASPDNPFSNLLDPVTRENMLAALLPIMDMVAGPGRDRPASEDDFSDEDDEMPDLIPVPRPTLRSSATAPQAAQDVDDDELPELVNEPSSAPRHGYPRSQQSPPRRTLMDSVNRLLPPDLPNSGPWTVFGPNTGNVFIPADHFSGSNDIIGVVAAALSYSNDEPTTTPLAPPPPRNPPLNHLPFPFLPRARMVPLDEDRDLPGTPSRARAPYHESDDELPDLIDEHTPASNSHPSIDDID
ncbi:hypothetical protein PHLGIDRAFT_35747 [Phlebiopsis gigantea 11061_1 CR5-6]|uniref:RING-type domain-containing protein n=1 Tax=Phlebiopsis gigantea (strain 11061_1 CR5-6) TaxID=745531 RepID=A0A0C3PKJ9_PHLG1|nr:hypothetical protein PHLGIDRAFT_35747 [Phlebiopsis gigantea 11061_1 CR5-6]